MIQFNLLPDIKVNFIKARKAKRAVIVIAICAVVISVSLLIIMILATLYQKRQISDSTKSIKTYENSINNTQDLAKILTIQNQLNSLPLLYAQRPVTSRLFGYIEQTTPAQISIVSVKLDFSNNSLVIDGTADGLESVNRYVDTYKFTNYLLAGSTDKTIAFSNVVLKAFTRDSKNTSYTVTLNFDPAIFDSSKTVTLDVPKTVTTRSQTQLPSSSVFDTKAGN
jgi:hypothetical protein